jgi:hypothetical protein
MRLLLALKCFFLVLFARRLPLEAAALLPTPPAPAPALPPPTAAKEGGNEGIVVETAPPALATTEPALPTVQPVARPKPADDGVRGAVQLLAILQREGRLLDFLQEDIDAYSDAQIGAAVRDVHRGCKRALAEYVPVEPVMKEQENARVRVDAGFDPSRIRLVGNVLGEPPYTGTLRHHGWRTATIKLPAPPVAADPSVVAPAEVEL